MNITFRCPRELQALLPRPVLASEGLPDWVRSMPASAAVPGFGDEKIRTVKRCPPFLDAMRFGFLMPLVADVVVRDGAFSWDWDVPASMPGGVTRAPIGFHLSEQATGSPLHDPQKVFIKFNNFWAIRLPEGFSLLVCHPINREDLPFRTLSGLVDADRYPGLIQFPARWLDPGFEGTLSRGTPIAQCIPVPRQSLSLDCGALEGQGLENFVEVNQALGAEPGTYRKRYRAPR
jgi:hypothetical protein